MLLNQKNQKTHVGKLGIGLFKVVAETFLSINLVFERADSYKVLIDETLFCGCFGSVKPLIDGGCGGHDGTSVNRFSFDH
jgi:hypothetical protein